jgi:uncharacterized protein YuzE
VRNGSNEELSYFADTDSLYIDLSEEPSVESREISDGVVLDYNAAGRLVGIDIDEASKREMDKLVLSRLSSTSRQLLYKARRNTTMHMTRPVDACAARTDLKP